MGCILIETYHSLNSDIIHQKNAQLQLILESNNNNKPEIQNNYEKSSSSIRNSSF